jgi:hypothetical protein
VSDHGKCRSCKTRVRWAIMHPSGKRNPLNPEPDAERGNTLIIETERAAAYFGAEIGRAVTLSASDLELARRGGRELYLSHFVTCPQRGQWKAKT